MPEIIRKYDNKNKPILEGNKGITPLTYFNIIHLRKGESIEQIVEMFETVYVILSGKCDIKVTNQLFKNIRRKDIWSDKADSIYVTTGALVKIYSKEDNTEIAVAGARCEKEYKPFRITPEEVSMIEVGSSETKTLRRINYIIGSKTKEKTGNIIINELYAEEGCWSGYPPHKHDDENKPIETAFEELYHYRFNPTNGFGGQFVYQLDGTSVCFMTTSGDTVLIDKGYHPTVYSPGHEGYMFVILVGKYQHSLIQNFDQKYKYLSEGISGIQNMLDNYQKCK